MNVPIKNEVIEEAKRGSRTAWNELYEKEKNFVKKIVRYKIHPTAEEIDTIVNSIFSRVHEKLNTYSSTYSFEPWLFQVTVNFCKRYISNKLKRIDYRAVPIDDICIETIRTVDNPELLFISKESIYKFIEFLQRYNERDFDILYLRFVEAYKYEDIVKETGVNISTIKNVIRRYKPEIESYFMKH